MSELNLYRAQFKARHNCNALVCVRAQNLDEAELLLNVVYKDRLLDETIEQVNERRLELYSAQVHLPGLGDVVTEVWAETEIDAKEQLSVLYRRRNVSDVHRA